MNNFVFFNPTKVLFGKNTIPQIGLEIKNAGIKKVLLLAGGGSIKSNGVYETVTKSLKKHGVESIELFGVRPNPTLDHANEAINIIKKHKLEAVLAVGGGSVIDEAKSVSAGVFVDNLWDIFEHKAVINEALPIFTVLTISATCSEMDQFAVLSNEAEKKKWGTGSPLLFPKVSVIDPSVQTGLPWHQTVNGGVDAMSHTMEFYFVTRSQELTQSVDEALMRTIIKSVDSLKIDESNYNSRADLAWSAVLALNGNSGAGSGSGDWASHAIEHGISALHPEVAHGAGLAVVFPAWIKYCAAENPNTFARWAQNVWNVSSVEEGIEKMKAKYKEWGAPVSLRDLNIDKSEIPAIAANAAQAGNPGNLKSLSAADIEKILEIAY